MASSGSSANLAQLANEIGRLFNKEELALLCGDLGIDPDNIAGDTKLTKARDLVQYCDRRGRLQELVDTISHQRPTANLRIPMKSASPPTGHDPLNPLVILIGIISGIIVTVVGGLIVFRLTQAPAASAVPTETSAVTAIAEMSVSTSTAQIPSTMQVVATTQPSPVPPTQTTIPPTDSPTETPAPSPAQLPSPTALPPTTSPTASIQIDSCPAEINPKQGDKLGPGIVRKQPRGSETAILVNELEARDKVILVKMIVYSREEVWFKMTDLNDRDIGWIEQTYVVKQPDCQVSE